SNPHGKWWSYRIIDGRKCWYEGKPMLSKASLEWPKEIREAETEQASVQPAPSAKIRSGAPEKVRNILSEKPGDPMDSQALAPRDSDTFESLWRARVKN